MRNRGHFLAAFPSICSPFCGSERERSPSATEIDGPDWTRVGRFFDRRFARYLAPILGGKKERVLMNEGGGRKISHLAVVSGCRLWRQQQQQLRTWS